MEISFWRTGKDAGTLDQTASAGQVRIATATTSISRHEDFWENEGEE
jgi:hypothetical protein